MFGLYQPFQLELLPYGQEVVEVLLLNLDLNVKCEGEEFLERGEAKHK